MPYILIPLAVGFVFFMVKKENERALNHRSGDDFVIRLPETYLWVGAICAAVFLGFLVLMILFPNDTVTVWVGIVFLGFILLGLSIAAAQVNWRIHVQKDRLSYTTVFGRRYDLGLAEIKKVRLTPNALTIKIDNKTFTVDPHALGLDVLLQRFKEIGITVEQ
ncbi:MAG: DUF6560 family protein [Bacteroidota bacterium]